ncbi:MAG: Txe/YoeB family addiction module toxin [Ignavibacteria bacterium]|nr:Txe/YoeB family addiction module toxin [Ignavibacteria bacterium]
MRKIILTNQALEDLNYFAQNDVKLLTKIFTLIKETLRTPFEGIGKPEPLKHKLSGCWSRRINDEHRLVYQVSESALTILSCRYHY